MAPAHLVRCWHEHTTEETAYQSGNRIVTYLVCADCGETLRIIEDRRVTEF
jgi:hypothetical protein